MAADFDLVVIGGGSAGFAAAIRGADLGARVALVESGTLGGTCVNVGCVPSKTLLRAAEAGFKRTHHGFAGIPALNGAPDWPAIRAQKDELVDALRREKYADVLRAYDAITLISQKAAFHTDRALQLTDGRTITGGRVVLATGASPWAPPVSGLTETGLLDNSSAMELHELPASMIVIGGSAVGLELGQMFARLGVRVTVLEALPRLLPSEDSTLGEELAGYLRGEGIHVHTGVRVERAEKETVARTIWFEDTEGRHSVQAESILVATGRRANTTGFGADAAGVEVGKKGEIVVNEFLQTSSPHVYAAGDVIGDPMFVYVAAYAGTLAAENALQGDVRRYELSAVPRVTFTDPGVASVGLTEAEAVARGVEARVAHLPLHHVPRSRAAHDTRGFVRLVADAHTQRILGAQILAAEAGEMITEATLAVRLGLTIDDLTSAFHPYLTLSEGLKLAAQTFTKDVAKLSCCAS